MKVRALILTGVLLAVACTTGGQGGEIPGEDILVEDVEDAAPVDIPSQEAGDPGPDMPDVGSEDTGFDLLGTDVQAPGPNVKNASMFEAGAIVDYYVTVEPEDWDFMVESAYQGIELYIPVRFEYQGEAFEKAAMRLKGNVTDWIPENKLQFVIRFNWYDKTGRFRGLRRVFLEANPNDDSTCRNNLSLHVMREAGAPTPRSNHARLHVNGEYHALYENIEYVDKEFLEDRFAFPEGNLYKYGEVLKTNETLNDTSDLETYQDLVWGEPPTGDHTQFYAEVQEIVDIPALLLHLAVEATLPAADSFWSGGWNYYLYNNPQSGFVILPWDLDDVMHPELAPTEADPLTWISTATGDTESHPLWALARQNPVWREEFLFHLERIERDIYRDLGKVAQACCERVWSDLQKDHKPFDKEDFDANCQALQDHIHDRAFFLREFLEDEGL